MTLDLPISESRLTNAARLIHQSMWLLFIISTRQKNSWVSSGSGSLPSE